MFPSDQILICIYNDLSYCCCPQLHQNVKNLTQNLNRIMLTLKDNSVITLDKMPTQLVQRTKDYLEKLRQGKTGNDTPAARRLRSGVEPERFFQCRTLVKSFMSTRSVRLWRSCSDTSKIRQQTVGKWQENLKQGLIKR